MVGIGIKYLGHPDAVYDLEPEARSRLLGWYLASWAEKDSHGRKRAPSARQLAAEAYLDGRG